MSKSGSFSNFLFDREKMVQKHRHHSPSPICHRSEPDSFISTALIWTGSITPLVLMRVIELTVYATIVTFVELHLPQVSLVIEITPFEYSGIALSLLLLLRINAGHDRWWEARKHWGCIVNQSRNLAVGGYVYASPSTRQDPTFLRWVAAWPYVMMASLRKTPFPSDVSRLLGKEEAEKIERAPHPPTEVARRIAALLQTAREQGLDGFAFLSLERERCGLIDAFGACERIQSTPMPLSIAVTVRRFILLFLLLLPLALIDRVGWVTPLIVALVSYPLYAVDQIAVELQEPFEPGRVSHLALEAICANIEKSVLSVGEMALTGS